MQWQKPITPFSVKTVNTFSLRPAQITAQAKPGSTLSSYDHETRSSVYAVALSKKNAFYSSAKSDEETVAATEEKAPCCRCG